MGARGDRNAGPRRPQAAAVTLDGATPAVPAHIMKVEILGPENFVDDARGYLDEAYRIDYSSRKLLPPQGLPPRHANETGMHFDLNRCEDPTYRKSTKFYGLAVMEALGCRRHSSAHQDRTHVLRLKPRDDGAHRCATTNSVTRHSCPSSP